MPKSFNLEQLRNQARELLRAFRGGDAKAAARVARVLPYVTQKPLRLAQAQAAIARENHFPSWPKLKAAVEKDEARRKRRSARQSLIRRVIDETIARARAGDAVALTRITPFGKEAAVQIVDAISADRSTLDMVVGVYIAGLQHPNPNVRYTHLTAMVTSPRSSRSSGLATIRSRACAGWRCTLSPATRAKRSGPSS